MFAIIEKLGGREAVLDILDRRLPKTSPRTPFAVAKWFTNREIPARCQWALAREAEERGITYEHQDFEFAARDDAEAA